MKLLYFWLRCLPPTARVRRRDTTGALHGALGVRGGSARRPARRDVRRGARQCVRRAAAAAPTGFASDWLLSTLKVKLAALRTHRAMGRA